MAGRKVADWRCPVTSKTVELHMVSLGDLQVSRFQRPLSSALVKSLVMSSHFGFINPPICVITDGVYEVIDGQHRIEALKEHQVSPNTEIPVIVAPPEWRELVLCLNIEKTDNVKDKCR